MADSSNYANRHGKPGLADDTPISNQDSRGPADFGNSVESSDNVYHSGGPSGTQPSSTIQHTGDAAKWDTVSGTEIGDPHGRIPTARDTREQLAAARASELPPGVPSNAPGVPRSGYEDASPGTSETVRQYRSTNYAPGYEDAAEAVPQKRHEAADHKPNLLSHEPVTPLTEVPPNLQGHPQSPSDGYMGKTPGSTVGQKAKAPFAKVHGAGEVLRGNINTAIDTLTGDHAGQAKDEATVRKGQEEFTHGRFEKGTVPPA